MKLSPGLIDLGSKALNKSLFNIGNPEFWHKFTLQKLDSAEKVRTLLDFVGESLYLEDPLLRTEIGNIELKNPVGISAGLLKQPYALKFFENIGLGYLVIGGITKVDQPGNNAPRIFRFGNDVVNGMGLPGKGWVETAKMLTERKESGYMPNIPIIANLCNSLITPEKEKVDEFLFLMNQLYPYVDGFEINISCPNQCGVTSMQEENRLSEILNKVTNFNKKLALQFRWERKVILVKIAPVTRFLDEPEKIKDLTPEGIEIIANVCNNSGIDGVTATNTSQEHNYNTKIITASGGEIKGGLSGLSLHAQSLETVKLLKEKLDKNIPIIGVGGIGYDKGQSGVNMIEAGASAIGVLSSLTQNSIAVPYNLKKAILESKNNY